MGLSDFYHLPKTLHCHRVGAEDFWELCEYYVRHLDGSP